MRTRLGTGMGNHMDHTENMVIQGNCCVFWNLGMSNIISIADTTDIHHIFMGLKAFIWVPVMGQPWAMVTES